MLRDQKIEEKIKKVCREIEESARPQNREFDESLDSDAYVEED